MFEQDETGEGKTVLEEMGIDRPLEWMETAIDVLHLFEKEKYEALEFLVRHLLKERHSHLIPILMNDSVVTMVMEVAKMFLQCGYLKGVYDGEEKAILAKLNGLWKEDKKE